MRAKNTLVTKNVKFVTASGKGIELVKYVLEIYAIVDLYFVISITYIIEFNKNSFCLLKYLGLQILINNIPTIDIYNYLTDKIFRHNFVNFFCITLSL